MSLPFASGLPLSAPETAQDALMREKGSRIALARRNATPSRQCYDQRATVITRKRDARILGEVDAASESR